jgi:hypothetical protein
MPEFNISSGLPSYPSGLSDKDAALVLPLYRAINSLAQQLSAQTGSVQYSAAEQASIDQFTKFTSQRTRKISVQAAETLGFGNVVTLSISGGKIVAHKADATNLSRPAHAIIDVPTGIASGSFGEAIFMQGKSSGISGTSFGSAYYLSTAGQVQVTPPVATGVINQIVGIGLGSAGFYFDAEIIGRRVALAYKFSPTVLRVLYTDGTSADLPV